MRAMSADIFTGRCGRSASLSQFSGCCGLYSPEIVRLTSSSFLSLQPFWPLWVFLHMRAVCHGPGRLCLENLRFRTDPPDGNFAKIARHCCAVDGNCGLSRESGVQFRGYRRMITRLEAVQKKYPSAS